MQAQESWKKSCGESADRKQKGKGIAADGRISRSRNENSGSETAKGIKAEDSNGGELNHIKSLKFASIRRDALWSRNLCSGCNVPAIKSHARRCVPRKNSSRRLAGGFTSTIDRRGSSREGGKCFSPFSSRRKKILFFQEKVGVRQRRISNSLRCLSAFENLAVERSSLNSPSTWFLVTIRTLICS